MTTASPTCAALITFAAFILAGLLPLLPLCLGAWLAAAQMFVASAVLKGLTIVRIGVARGRVKDRS